MSNSPIKIIVILLVFVSCSLMLTGQIVDSIKFEQKGNIIKLRYQITNSNPKQIFKISVFYTDDKNLRKEIHNLEGDFGEGIVGGKPEYLIVWDVLKEVDILTSAEFFIRGELIQGKPNKTTYPHDKKFYITPIIEFPDPLIGLKISYAANWGVSLSVLKGERIADTLHKESQFSYSLMDSPVETFTISAGISKCLSNKKYFKMHFICGFALTSLKGGFGRYYDKYLPNSVLYTDNETSYNIEPGLLFGLKRLALSLNLAIPLDSKSRPMSGSNSRLICGMGLRF